MAKGTSANRSLPTSLAFQDLIGIGPVTFFSCRYFYVGNVVGVSPDGKWIEIEQTNVVYETGGFSDTQFSDAQPLWPDGSKVAAKWRLNTEAIESYGILDKEVAKKK